MILNSYIHQQLADARRRDFLEAAERARLSEQTHQHEGARQRLGSPLRWRARRRRASVQPCQRATTTPTAAR